MAIASPWLTVKEAAQHAWCGPKLIYREGIETARDTESDRTKRKLRR